MLGKIAVIWLGYVVLPVVATFAEKFLGIMGFDIDTRRVAALRGGEEWTGEVDNDRLRARGLIVTHELSRFKSCGIFVVCVPTPSTRTADSTLIRCARLLESWAK